MLLPPSTCPRPNRSEPWLHPDTRTHQPKETEVSRVTNGVGRPPRLSCVNAANESKRADAGFTQPEVNSHGDFLWLQQARCSKARQGSVVWVRREQGGIATVLMTQVKRCNLGFCILALFHQKMKILSLPKSESISHRVLGILRVVMGLANKCGFSLLWFQSYSARGDVPTEAEGQHKSYSIHTS